MFENIEKTEIISSLHGVSKNTKTKVVKKYNAFYFRTSGEGTYVFDDKSYTTKKNEVFFVPKGSCYNFICPSESNCSFVSINFEAEIKNPVPMIFSAEDFSETEYICNHFPYMWKLGTASEKYKCISLFYSFLSYIANIENQRYEDKNKFDLIEPGITYLKKHIFDSSLKANRLHSLCGISDTYFRKIFISKFGISPQEYIISKRISHAKSILDSCNYNSISEVSQAVGYTDPLYFSRAFKKKYGVSPININLK